VNKLSPSAGKVYLVGGGPGDPGLLTLRGAQCLARADVVVYDYLVNPRILSHARDTAERICLGRHGRDRLLEQPEIDRILVERALAGAQVVRLKGGDPAVFAHESEEIDALVRAGVPYEIVPGISAATAAGSYAGIPITHGEAASAVAFVTGQERAGKEAPALDYKSLVNFPGTLVFYMGVTTASHWTTALILDGKPADTPAAIVHRCSLPDQQVFRCTLGTVADVIERHKLRPPAIVIVGKVVDLAPAQVWFESRPLARRAVLVTRAEDQAQALGDLLAELGAAVFYQAAISIAPPSDWQAVDRAIDGVAAYHWLVFSSANGVRFFLDRLRDRNKDLRALGHAKLAAIGPGTAEALASRGLRADFVPDEFRAESLAAGLAGQARGEKFLLLRASRGREVLAEELAGAGAAVEQVVVYESRDVTELAPDVADALVEGRIDWVTVTSSAIARSLHHLLGSALAKLKLASISPVTSGVLRELGYEPAAEATHYTMEGLAEAILCAEASTDRARAQGESPGG